jgi:ribonuclease BN (tRNA processing enzyme)
VALAHDGAAPSLVLDAGTGLRRLSGRLGGSAFSGTILLTHLHWDHVQGLPFFAAGDRDDAEVRLVMPEQGDPKEVLSRALSPPHFPIGPDGLRGSWRFEAWVPGRHRAEGFEVLALDIAHKGGRTYGYRVDDGRSSVAFLPDHLLVDAPQAGPVDPVSLDPVAVDGGDTGRERPDTAWANALTLARDVDVLVHDAQFIDAERAVAEAYGHATVEATLGLAEEAGARRLVLFHHGPDRTDAQLDRLMASVMGVTSVSDPAPACPAPARPRPSGGLAVEIGTERRVLDLPERSGAAGSTAGFDRAGFDRAGFDRAASDRKTGVP